MRVLLQVALTAVGLNTSGGDVFPEVHVASQNANSGLNNATVSHPLQLSECFLRLPFFCRLTRRSFVRGCPNVQLSLHEASHLTLVTLRCDTKIPDHELRFRNRGREFNTRWVFRQLQ